VVTEKIRGRFRRLWSRADPATKSKSGSVSKSISGSKSRQDAAQYKQGPRVRGSKGSSGTSKIKVKIKTTNGFRVPTKDSSVFRFSLESIDPQILKPCFSGFPLESLDPRTLLSIPAAHQSWSKPGPFSLFQFYRPGTPGRPACRGHRLPGR